MKAISCSLIFLTLSTPVYAALPPSQELRDSKKVGEGIVAILELPLENRVQALKAQGDEGLARLRVVAFDSRFGLKNRWRAVTMLGHVYGEKAQDDLEKALTSSEWYMRNAALVAIEAVSREMALKWSVRLLNDPALVVRTAAVQTLGSIGGVEAEELLWKKLDSPENFNKGQSLWVRKHIVRVLSQFASAERTVRFVSLLKDPDVRLHPYALAGLEKISGISTGDKFGLSKPDLKSKTTAWLNWWGSQTKGSF